MFLAEDKQTLGVAVIGAIVATSLVASVGALSAFVMIVIVTFGPSIVFLPLWQETRQSACLATLRQHGHAVSALIASQQHQRRRRRPIAWMSTQWLAEHRAANP